MFGSYAIELKVIVTLGEEYAAQVDLADEKSGKNNFIFESTMLNLLLLNKFNTSTRMVNIVM